MTLPLSMPGVVAGTLLIFIPAAGDYINAELLGTPNEYMIGNVIDVGFLVRLRLPAGGGAVVPADGGDPRAGLRSTCAGPARRRWSDARSGAGWPTAG